MTFEVFMRTVAWLYPGRDAFGQHNPDTDEMRATLLFPLEEVSPEDVVEHVDEALTSQEFDPQIEALEMLRPQAKERIKQSWLNDIATVGMPVPGYDFAVDYDINDYLIWSGGVGLLDPEATEVEVRSIDDQYHTIPVATYQSIPDMQMAYYAQQLQKKWALQKAIDAAETVEEIVPTEAASVW